MSASDVDAFEQAVDESFESLPIFRLPFRTAMGLLLTMFGRQVAEVDSQYGRISMSAVVNTLNYRRGLACLVDAASQRCSKETPFAEVSDPSALFAQAGEALQFSVSYAEIADCFVLYHRGVLNAHVSGQKLRFVHKSDEGIAREALNVTIQRYMRSDQVHVLRQAPSVEASVNSLAADRFEAGRKADEEILNDALWERARRLATLETPTPDLPEETSCGGYSINEVHQAWLHLRTLAQLNHSILHAGRAQGFPAWVEGPYIFGYSLRFRGDLAAELSAHSAMPIEICRRILHDLTLQPEALERDIEVTPIVRIEDGYLIPHDIVLSSNWEENILRVWRTRHADDFGSLADRQKRGLPQEVADSIPVGRDFMVSQPNRKLVREGRTVTDVDVAVLSRIERLLIFMEVKWPIAPDTLREIRKGNDEILKGFEQLDTAIKMMTEVPQQTLDQLFPNQNLQAAEIDQVRGLVFVREFYPSVDVDLRYPVVPVDAAIEYLSQATAGLERIYSDLEEPPQPAKMIPGYRELEISILLGGREYLTPTWASKNVLSLNASYTETAGANDRCPCGTGAKYKKCCRLLTGSRKWNWHRIVPAGGEREESQ